LRRKGSNGVTVKNDTKLSVVFSIRDGGGEGTGGSVGESSVMSKSEKISTLVNSF